MNELLAGKVLQEEGTPYLYIIIDNEVWLLHSADKRIFKATYYSLDTFKLPNKQYTVLDRHSIKID